MSGPRQTNKADQTPAAPTTTGPSADTGARGGAMHGQLRATASYEEGASLLSPVQMHGDEGHAHKHTDEGGEKEGGRKDAKKKVDHISAKKADGYIQQEIGKLVKGIPTGKVAEGKVRIVDDAQFKKAYFRYFGDDGEYDITNAFVERNSPDGGDIAWIHENRGNPGTPVHEAMHLYSDAAYRTTLGSKANEGATEYFTRYVLKAVGAKVERSNYQSDYELTVSLVSKATQDVVAQAYFKGDLASLEKKLGTETYEKFKTAIKAGKRGEAGDALK